MLTNVQPRQADRRPLGGFGIGVLQRKGSRVGSLVKVAAPVWPPRVQRTAWPFELNVELMKAGPADAARNYNCMPSTSPVHGGAMGPHPAREPEPV